ncbi:MAG: FAD-dependent thymidylate synthase, partial [Chloroflexota bacterium]|nr:FAD-dependent thymidylate synthase [Chloroflexota bacterium]
MAACSANYYRLGVTASEFDEQERDIIEPFFTNLDRRVFALRNLPEVVKGALFSRYSRSAKSLRRTFLDEFVRNEELGLEHVLGTGGAAPGSAVAADKAEQFYERVLVGYGDDSVAELGGAHVALEGISALAAKEIEDSRIGLSPLEKSTRYVYFDQRVNGQYQYVRPAEAMASPLGEAYVRCMDACYGTYSELIEPLTRDLEAAHPREEGVSERAYRTAIRAKAADVLRALLPAGHLTNMGVFGNGRAFEYLLIKMAASPLAEVRQLGHELAAELAIVIPAFTKRAGNERGRDYSSYLRARRLAAAAAADQLAHPLLTPHSSALSVVAVRIVDFDAAAEEKVLAAILYPQATMALSELRQAVAEMPLEERRAILNEHVAGRRSRHQRPGRAFEMADYTVEFLANFGVYKDLQRHRMCTQERQALSTLHGFTTPPELAVAPYAGRFEACMQLADETHRSLAGRFPAEAQYVVPMAYRLRWLMKMNLRE